MTIYEAAQRANLRYLTIYAYVREGRIPATRCIGRWFIEEADFAKWLRTRNTKAQGRRKRRGRGTGGSYENQRAYDAAQKETQ